MKTKLVSFIILSCFFIPHAFTQSTQEASNLLTQRFEECIGKFRSTLEEVAEDPSKLDILARVSEQNTGTLDTLDGEIDSQLDFVTKKEAGIASSGLAESDRKELLNALALQKKPLTTLKSSTGAWKKVFSDYKTTTEKEWRTLYSSFSEIAGPEKAKAKLTEKINAYSAKLPWPSSKTTETSKYPIGAPSKVGSKGDDNGLDPVKMDTATLKTAAKNGNPSVEYELGRRYKDGSEISRDTDQAVYWFTRAAEKGNVDAQMALGMMYRIGDGVGVNRSIAKKWLSKAAESGNQYAKSILQNMR
jgi:TPR repeat protein